MKTQFQNVFKDPNKAKELWDANPNFFKTLDPDLDDYTELVQLAENNEFINLINWVY